MSSYEQRNATIRSTFLGVEEHGVFTFYMTLDYGGTSQAAGGHVLEASDAPAMVQLFRRIIAVTGAPSWEAMPGRPVVALIEGGRVVGLAPYLPNGPAAVVFSEVLES